MPTLKTAPAKKRRPTLRQRMESTGPSRAQLRRLAKKNRPPQSWYDQTVNPFKSK